MILPVTHKTDDRTMSSVRLGVLDVATVARVLARPLTLRPGQPI